MGWEARRVEEADRGRSTLTVVSTFASNVGTSRIGVGNKTAEID